MVKRKSLIGAIVIVLAGAACWPFIHESSKVEGATMNRQSDAAGQKRAGKKTVFACNMLALTTDERKRHIEVTKRLRAITKEARELSDGYGFRFNPEQSNILLVSEFIARERLCCPFFTFEIVVESEEGPLWMRLRGDEGVKEFIQAEFGIK